MNNLFIPSSLKEVRYKGIANPSGAVALNNNQFIVADDEDNLLRIYNRGGLDKPVQTVHLSAVFPGQIADGEDLEIDIESAAKIEDMYYWIGSHSTSRKGEFRPSRHRLIAVDITSAGKGQFTISAAGKIYNRLIDDLIEDSRFASYHLAKAKTTQAKAIGGLSIEGLAATKNKSLLIGFRNPLIGGKIKDGRLEKGKALLVELLNPFEVIYGVKGRFGDPLELDLDGFGIREITWLKNNKYLVVAGPYHENLGTDNQLKEESRLYKWFRKSGKVNCLKKIQLDTLNIEAAIIYPANDKHVQLLSDDGKLGAKREFRSLTITL